MRSRPFTATAAALAIALSLAACGGDDDPVAPSTAGTVVPDTSPVDPLETPPSTDAPTPSGDAGDAGEDEGGTPTTGGDRSPERKPSGKLLPDVAETSSDLTNFSTALGASGLGPTLEADGPFTVFAPNNDGFAKLGTRLDGLLQPASKSELVNILSFHVVKGEFEASDLKDGKLLTTLQGTRLRVERKGDRITLGNSLGDAAVVSSDLVAGNGVIHVIDTVLNPKS